MIRSLIMEVWMADRHESMILLIETMWSVLKVPAAGMNAWCRHSSPVSSNMFASCHLISTLSVQHWSNRFLHAILASFHTGNVMMVMGCSPLDVLLVATSINLLVDVSLSLASSSWICASSEHLPALLQVSVRTTLFLLDEVALLPALMDVCLVHLVVRPFSQLVIDINSTDGWIYFLAFAWASAAVTFVVAFAIVVMAVVMLILSLLLVGFWVNVDELVKPSAECHDFGSFA